MQVADLEKYEEMIKALGDFKKGVNSECTIMLQAMKDAVDNTSKDVNVVKASAGLLDKAKKIHDSAAEVDELIADLKSEMEDIKKTAVTGGEE